jgi:NAD(P)-dependent dehydrogenase (short-subunit alcohol dehydrogenase family)
VREDAELTAAADRCLEKGADVTWCSRPARPESVEELYSSVTALGRPLDAAALNAGSGGAAVFWEIPLADLLSVVDLNVRSTLHLARLLLPDMVARNEVGCCSPPRSPPPCRDLRGGVQRSKSFRAGSGRGSGGGAERHRNHGDLADAGADRHRVFERAEMEDTRLGQSKKDDPAKVAKDGLRSHDGR